MWKWGGGGSKGFYRGGIGVLHKWYRGLSGLLQDCESDGTEVLWILAKPFPFTFLVFSSNLLGIFKVMSWYFLANLGYFPDNCLILYQSFCGTCLKFCITFRVLAQYFVVLFWYFPKPFWVTFFGLSRNLVLLCYFYAPSSIFKVFLHYFYITFLNIWWSFRCPFPVFSQLCSWYLYSSSA